jgi:uroporphyrinogen decarboxylase
MDSRERIRTLISGETADRCGFWLGNPHGDSWPAIHAYLGTSTQEEARCLLHDDFRWIPAGVYRHPDGRGMFDIPNKTAHGSPGPFAECEDAAQVDELYEWPNPDYLDFEPVIEQLRQCGPFYRASGFWAPFYHHVMDLFGMEQYMMNMHLNPELVHAVTDRVCSFYHEANERFFDAAGALMDGYFFGNDFGTQLNLICGPAQFDEFVMPWFRRFTEQAHARDYQVILHSCGSVHKVIDRLIDAGVECLHPLQALAADMDANTLARDFGGRIAFLGGIDTQELLVNGSPEDVRADVRRVRQILGPNVIISPSHEALLPNVPPANIQAMAAAAVA